MSYNVGQMHRYTITRWRQQHGTRDLFRIPPPSFRESWDDLWNNRWSGLLVFVILCVGVVALILVSGASHDRILKKKEPIYRRMTTESQTLGER